MINNRFHQRKYSIISLIISGLCILITIYINFNISQRYLQSDRKTQLLFVIIEKLVFYYQYYFAGLSLAALIFAILSTKRKENRLINLIAYIVGLFSLIIIFLRVWRLMI